MNLPEIRAEAQREWEAEQRRTRVQSAVAILRSRSRLTWWQRLFPWQITITKRSGA